MTHLVHDEEPQLGIGERLDERPPIPLVPSIRSCSRTVLDYLLSTNLQDTPELRYMGEDVTACLLDALLLG